MTPCTEPGYHGDNITCVVTPSAGAPDPVVHWSFNADSVSFTTSEPNGGVEWEGPGVTSGHVTAQWYAINNYDLPFAACGTGPMSIYTMGTTCYPAGENYFEVMDIICNHEYEHGRIITSISLARPGLQLKKILESAVTGDSISLHTRVVLEASNYEITTNRESLKLDSANVYPHTMSRAFKLPLHDFSTLHDWVLVDGHKFDLRSSEHP